MSSCVVSKLRWWWFWAMPLAAIILILWGRTVDMTHAVEGAGKITAETKCCFGNLFFISINSCLSRSELWEFYWTASKKDIPHSWCEVLESMWRILIYLGALQYYSKPCHSQPYPVVYNVLLWSNPPPWSDKIGFHITLQCWITRMFELKRFGEGKCLGELLGFTENTKRNGVFCSHSNRKVTT